MTPEEAAYFRRLKRAERERLERFRNDPEERKRFVLRCQHNGNRKKPPVTLKKLDCLA